MFGPLLSKQYPEFKESLTLNELLNWESWPGFIRILGILSGYCALQI